ncbi:hypothetical protein SZ64_09975 [Erythrobacter sp. SG61-1L]|uniref:hypothetical protein n=1 Tax=Erythrobacter sp. SG61-1L TaxID=1603897 RepID=UPI0006C8E878|nr:hypothetical protein [Erythrobacter sp. SG61-1L]KPL68417.1 hypothetical protein SZ64_09975 [Erythrobacter sp. SG61-1L]
MKHWLTLGALTLLAACGEAGSQGGDAPSENSAQNTEEATPTVASATRDDVVEAINCHLALSGMMATQITSSSSAPPRRFSPSVSYWHGLIDERAKAAGIGEAELKDLRAQVIKDRTLAGDTEESKTFGEDCYARAPSA